MIQRLEREHPQVPTHIASEATSSADRAQEEDPALPSGDTAPPTEMTPFDFGSISILPPEPLIGPHGGELNPSLAARIRAQQGGGAPLESSVQRRMEGAFSHHFADVRIHTDSEADALSHSIGANAFTLGSDVFLSHTATGAGPHGGDRLLAHELTHVVQQQGGQQDAGLRVTAASDPQEQTAVAIAEQVHEGRTVEMTPAVAPIPVSVAPIRVQRDPVKGAHHTQAATPTPTLASLAHNVAVLQKKQQATSLDLKWGAKFGKKLSSYKQAVWRITGAIDAAANGFQTAQVAQAQTDQAWAQFEGLVISVGFAAGFEWMFRGFLGQVGTTLQKIDDTVELVENPANALVGGLATNVRTTYIANQDAQQGQMPGLGGGITGAVAFLATQSEALEKHSGDIEGAFLERSEKLEKMVDKEWETFDVGAQEATYTRLYGELEAAGKGVEALHDGKELALIVERHLWAAWIQGQHTALIDLVSGLGDVDTGEVGQKYPQALSNFGSDINQRLIDVGIEERAGTDLYIHWYTRNEYGWGEKLMHWAQTYKESLLK